MVILKIRHRATFPHRSIIAAAGLNFGVRDGNRCIPCAKSTGLAALRLGYPINGGQRSPGQESAAGSILLVSIGYTIRMNLNYTHRSGISYARCFLWNKAWRPQTASQNIFRKYATRTYLRKCVKKSFDRLVHLG
jgi:hypothetical protein